MAIYWWERYESVTLVFLNNTDDTPMDRIQGNLDAQILLYERFADGMIWVSESVERFDSQLTIHFVQ